MDKAFDTAKIQLNTLQFRTTRLYNIVRAIGELNEWRKGDPPVTESEQFIVKAAVAQLWEAFPSQEVDK